MKKTSKLTGFIITVFILMAPSIWAQLVVFDHTFDGANGTGADSGVWGEVVSGGSVLHNGAGQLVMTGNSQFNNESITSLAPVFSSNTGEDFEVEFHLQFPVNPNIHYAGVRTNTSQADFRGYFFNNNGACGSGDNLRLNCDQGGSGCGLGGCPATEVRSSYAIGVTIGLRMTYLAAGTITFSYNPDVLGGGSWEVLTPDAGATGAGLDTWPSTSPGIDFSILIDSNGCCNTDKQMILDRVTVTNLTVPVELSEFVVD